MLLRPRSTDDAVALSETAAAVQQPALGPDDASDDGEEDGDAEQLTARAAAASRPSVCPQTVADLRSDARFKRAVAGAPIELSRCGIPRARLFAFFDQVRSSGSKSSLARYSRALFDGRLFAHSLVPPLQIHSTGQDVPQAVDAVAALTIGKDTTYRDLAQVRAGAR